MLQEKELRTPAQRKVSSALLYEAAGTFDAAFNTKDPKKLIKPMIQRDARGRVLVDIKGDVNVARARVETMGGNVVGSSTAHGTTRAWVAVDKVVALADDPAITSVRAMMAKTNRHAAPNPKLAFGTRAQRVAAVQTALQQEHSPLVPTITSGISTGSVTSEGVKAHAVDRASRFFGVDGTGVTIGVLSDSDDFKEDAIASGDLPADTITVPGQDGRPGSGEGTAIMEIVHDMAPGAKIVFASAFNGPDSFADNIRTLRFTYHCDVILDDVFYYDESPYQDDIIAQAVDDVAADGALYFSSAGNEGHFDDGTSGTWEGDFNSAGVLATLPSGYTVQDFGNRVISNRIEAEGGPVVLQWADPSTLDVPQSVDDYDLFLLDPDLRTVVLASTDIQDGSGLPFEWLPYLIPAGYRVVVAAKPTAARRAVRVADYGGELALSTTGATFGHATAAGAFGAAAVDVAEAGGGAFTAGPTTPVELFSSDGPRRIFWDRNGNPANPAHLGATYASGGGVTRAKPDFAAADGVSTTLPSFSGLNPFFGTSAAAPHAGAIAGLMKAAVPTATTAQITSALHAASLDIGNLGFDRNSGWGIINAFNALARIGAHPAVFLESFRVLVTPTGGATFIAPGGGANVNITVLNSGGANATAVSGTLTSSSSNVHITAGTSTYPTILAGGTGTNDLPFAFTVDPATPCGTVLPFTLTLSYTGNGTHPFTIGFTVQVGHASSTFTNVAFAGAAVAIPDGDPTGADATLTMPDLGPVGTLRFHIDGTACSADAGSTTVGVDHTWVGDLTFTLKAPDGTTVTLFDRPGGAGNSGNNFCGTVLDDTAASSIQSIATADAPWTGSFQSKQALASFAGVSTAGTWTLHAVDNVGADVGNIRAFSIDVAGFVCTP